MACAAERPPSTSSSISPSSEAESEMSSRSSGRTFSMSSPNSGEASWSSRARIQLRFPRSVLISPLWASMRYGWASSQLGKVLVEKRECTSASRLTTRSSRRSGKYRGSCGAVSMPLSTMVRLEKLGMARLSRSARSTPRRIT